MLNLFDFSLRAQGFPVHEAKLVLQQKQALSDAAFESALEAQKKAIVAFHLKNNAFYRGIAGTANPDSWESLPVLTKKDLQQPLHKRLSDGYTTQKVYINKTSGSGGTPFTFAIDKFSHALSWEIFKQRYSWYDLNLNQSLQARFYGIPLDFWGYHKERFKDWLGSRYRFPVFDLSDEKLASFYRVFGKKKFEYLNGYTSSLVLFAKYLKGKGVVLKETCPSLKLTIATSEMLFESDKILLEKQFGVPVCNEYGASEVGLIAFTYDNLFQINHDSLFVEVLDANNQPVPNGTAGKIVITSLYNKAHPFIRYEIGDTGVLSDTSSIRHPVLEKLTGRTNDVAILPNGKKVPGLTFYYVTKSIIEEAGNVKEFVVSQIKRDSFVITYVSNYPFTEHEVKTVQKAMEKYLAPGLHVTFKRVTVLDRNQRGKLRQFTSNL